MADSLVLLTDLCWVCMFVFSDRTDGTAIQPSDELENLVYPRAFNSETLRRKDIWSLLDGARPHGPRDSEAWLPAGDGGWKHDHRRLGAMVYQSPLYVGLGWLIEKLVAESDHLPAVLVGSPAFFPVNIFQSFYDDSPTSRGDTKRMRVLRKLIKWGTGSDIIRGSSREYVEYIHQNFKKVLLVYNPGYHYIVFELVLQGEQGSYLRVWDGMDTYKAIQDPGTIPEVQVLLDVFFVEEEVAVYHRRAKGAPKQTPRSNGCLPFAFLTMVHLALDLTPPPITDADDGWARNYLLGCCVRGTLLPLPKKRLRL